MAVTVTLLIASGEPDPAWTLTLEQEQAFLDRLSAAPVPRVTVGPPGRRAGYAGIMVRDGDGERWVVYRGWIRGGANARVDDGRVLEQWLLDTGEGAVRPTTRAELTKQITPSDR